MQTRAQALEKEREDLKGKLAAQAAELQQSRASLEAGQSAMQSKDAALAKAVKSKEMAEELRRSDALLAKRLLHAQLKALGGEPLPGAASATEDSTLAANLALQAHDELQTRQMLLHTANELDASQRHAKSLVQQTIDARRTALSRELWLPEMCDVSATVRSANLTLLAGLRMPRAARPGVRGSGVSPGIAVLRQFGSGATTGDTTGSGQWAALGASVLFDTRSSEVSAMKLALAAQPAAHQQIALSFDHTGGLTGSVTAKQEALSARLFGTLDLNRVGGGRAGLDITYDLPTA